MNRSCFLEFDFILSLKHNGTKLKPIGITNNISIDSKEIKSSMKRQDPMPIKVAA